MELSVRDKVAPVTGAGKGIGRAIAGGLAAEGARLALVARSADELSQTASEIGTACGVEALAVPADLGTPTGVSETAASVHAHFGRMNTLVHNAGAIRSGAFLELPDEQWIEDLAIKPLGLVRMARAVFSIRSAQGGGRIVNVIGVTERNPRHTYLAGGAANAALINFTKGLAEPYARENILVTAVSPGATMTERRELQLEQEAQAEGHTIEQAREALEAAQPLGRMARSEDVADLVCFVVSSRASFLTGICVTIDGGASRGVYP